MPGVDLAAKIILEEVINDGMGRFGLQNSHALEVKHVLAAHAQLQLSAMEKQLEVLEKLANRNDDED